MAIGGKDLKWDPSLKEDHFDAVLLYDQEDVDVAITIKDFIENKIPSLEDGRRPRVSTSYFFVNLFFCPLYLRKHVRFYIIT